MSRIEKVLELKNITKKFGDFLANDDINFELGRGEIHALLGENGAGKSTLMNIVFGMYQPDGGEIYLYENKVKIDGPNHAIRLGIGMVHQHFKLVENFTVTENIILGMEPKKGHKINMKAASKEVEEISKKYGLEVKPNEKIENLSIGMQQKVEILKALYRGANVLIFDEPTAVLTPDEISELLTIMKNLVKEGKSIILITHKLKEIMGVSDKCTVIRKGKYIDTLEIKSTNENELAELMVGKNISNELEKKKLTLGRSILEMSNVSYQNKQGKYLLKDINLHVRAGEVVGVAGIDGNGQSELVESIVKMIEPTSGKIEINSTLTDTKTTREIYELGVSYVPADRHKHGLVLDKNIAENLMLIEYYKDNYNNGLQLDKKYIYKSAKESVRNYDIRAQDEHVLVRGMSGGNQQKIILAREIHRKPELLIVVQPTRGLDIGAISFIHNKIIELRDNGVAVLLISYELQEILTLSDKIKILFEGEFIGETEPQKTNDTELGLMMAGKEVQV